MWPPDLFDRRDSSCRCHPRRRDVGFGYAEGLEALRRSAGREGLDFYGVAGVNGEDGFGLRGVEAPGYGGGGGEEGLGLLGVEMQG